MSVFDSSPVPSDSVMVGACFPASNRRSTLGFFGKNTNKQKPNKKVHNPSTKTTTTTTKYPSNQTQSKRTKTPCRKTHTEEICQGGWKHRGGSVSPPGIAHQKQKLLLFLWGSGLLPHSELASFDSTRKVKICQITLAGRGQLQLLQLKVFPQPEGLLLGQCQQRKRQQQWCD